LPQHDRACLGAAAFRPGGESIDFSAYSVDSPAATAELQANLQYRFPRKVTIAWNPEAANSLDRQRVAAHRVLASTVVNRNQPPDADCRVPQRNLAIVRELIVENL
jgi:hypothetical protein